MRNSSLFVILISICVFWSLWFSKNLVASDFIMWFPDELYTSGSFPYLWRNTLGASGIGQNVLSTMWAWPVVSLISILSNAGISYVYITRIVFIGPYLLVGTFSILKLLKRFEIQGIPAIIGATVYLLNSYSLLLLDGGQLFVALSYSLMPLALFSFIEILEQISSKNFIYFLGSWLLISVLDLRIFVLLIILSLIYYLYHILFFDSGRTKSTLNCLFVLLTLCTTFLCLHLYWVLPMFISSTMSDTGLVLRFRSNDIQSFTTLGHSIFLLQPHWFANVFGKTIQVNGVFVIFPLLALLAPILSKKRIIGFWLIIFLVFSFLAKGINPPFSALYDTLLSDLPGFVMFRDPTKFFFLTALSISVLIAITSDEIEKRISSKYKFGKINVSIVSPIIISCLLLIIYPVYTDKMTGLFSKPAYVLEADTVSKVLKSDNRFARVLWIPSSIPLSFSSSTHPSIRGYELAEERPFSISRMGLYERDNYLRDATYMSDLMDVAGIGYVAYSFPDTRRENLSVDNVDYYYNFLNQLNELPWIEKQITGSPIALLKVRQSNDHLFLTQNIWYVIGSDNIYESFATENQLSDNALVFMEDGIASGVDLTKSRPIVLNKKTQIDAAVIISKSEKIFPASNLSADPDKEGWWRRDTSDFVSWREFLENKYSLENTDFDYGGGWAVAEGNLSKTFDNDKDGVLVMRMMESPKGGEVVLKQNDQEIGRIDTTYENGIQVTRKLKDAETQSVKEFVYDDSNIRWFEIGEVQSGDFNIETSGEINVINAYTVIPKDLWETSKAKVDQMIESSEIINWEDVELAGNTYEPEVSYEMVSPTEYQVVVSDVRRPTTLVFSEKFDELWTLNGNKSYPVYSLLNGFTINADGVYKLYYSPQKYVLPSMIIGWTLLLLMLIIVVKKSKNTKTEK